jgi:hypothetical protein
MLPLAMLLAFALSGCGDRQEWIAQQWRLIDIERDGKPLDDAQKADLLESDSQIEFRADGTFEARYYGKRWSGKYSILPSGDKFTWIYDEAQMPHDDWRHLALDELSSGRLTLARSVSPPIRLRFEPYDKGGKIGR